MTIAHRKRKELYPIKILSKTELVRNVFVLELEKKHSFLPGQVIAVSLNPMDEPRLYSIASGSKQKFLRILFDVNPNGKLTPPLAKRSIGDTIFVSEPFGKFTDTRDRAVWIATGTGIAPFISMLESGLAENKTLLHGARYIDQFYYANVFKAQMKDNYFRFCTTESDSDVISGRLTEYLKEKQDLSPEIKYYICGGAEMVVDVRDILISKGIPYDQIIAEIYF